jgi:hypothetical protein
VASSRSRHQSEFRSAFKRNVRFVAGLMGICAAVALGTAIMSGGLETMYRRASLAVTAINDPSKLTSEQKTEIKKLIKNKDDAKKYYEGLSSEEKDRAKQQFGSLSEDQKQKYKQMLGR